MGKTIQIDMADGTTEAYLTGDHGPGVLFFMDAIGLRPRLEEMADRIAGWGYVVLVPNVFYRDGTAADIAPSTDLRAPGAREEHMAKVLPLVGNLTPDKAEADIPRYLETLRAAAGVEPGPVGTTGYCMGARLAIRAACLDPDVVAVGGWHGGGLATDDDTSPHHGLPKARAEFVFGHADNDRSMPAEAISRLGAALRESGLTYTNEVYEGAAHGYSMADTPLYDEAAAERHFRELEGLFARTLGGSAS